MTLWPVLCPSSEPRRRVEGPPNLVDRSLGSPHLRVNLEDWKKKKKADCLLGPFILQMGVNQWPLTSPRPCPLNLPALAVNEKICQELWKPGNKLSSRRKKCEQFNNRSKYSRDHIA